MLAACLAVLGDRPGPAGVDNCEHLLDAVRDTVEVLLAACPRLAVLATSREPLGLAAEYVFRLAPLALPGSEPDLAGVALGRGVPRPGRAGSDPAPRRRLPTCDLVADIVRRLDGMPLAIELAAGRLSDVLARRPAPPARPRARPARRTGPAATPGTGRCGRPSSGPTTCSADDERRLFRHLAVFVDGVDLDDRRAARRRPRPGTRSGHRAGPPRRRLDDRRRPSPRAAPATGCWRRCGRSGSTGSRPRARTTSAARPSVALGGRPDRVDRRDASSPSASPRPTPCCAGSWRTCGPPGGWPATAGRVDDAAAMSSRCSTRSATATWSRSAAGPRSWRGSLDDPALAAHPQAAAVLGTAAEAAYHRGDYAGAERLARAGLDRATDDAARGTACAALSVAALARGAFAEAVEHCARRRRRRVRAAGRTSVVAALATAYAGDLDGRATLQRRGARRRDVAHDARLGRLRGRRDREPRRATPDRPSGTTCGPSTWPATLGRDLPRRRRHRRPARRARRRRPRRRRAARLPRGRSTTSPAPATGPTSGPPCATSPTCCAGSATTSPPPSSTPRPTRRPDAPAVDRAVRPPATAGRVGSAAPRSSGWPGRRSSGTSVGERPDSATHSPGGAPPRRTTPRRPTPCRRRRPGRRSGRRSGSSARPAPGPCGPRSGSSTRSTASRPAGVTTG